jgi:hypothetical protein
LRSSSTPRAPRSVTDSVGRTKGPNGIAYYHRDDFALFRYVTLDTVNPGGYADGSVGEIQLGWLEQRLIEVYSQYNNANGALVQTGNQDRLVVLVSHHGCAA